MCVCVLSRSTTIPSMLPVFEPCSCSKGGLLEFGLRIVEITRKRSLQPALHTLKKDEKGV